ncbi:MAG: hypothetical protein GY696_10900 [Gammaproteobacteria bacterium]|nr:hypothetical protein [Gammaproteobacteria bacterium]
MKSSWNIRNLDDPGNPRTLDQALKICNDLFGDNVHPMDSEGSEEVYIVAEEGTGGNQINLVRKPKSPSATCDKRGKEDNNDGDHSRHSRGKKCSSSGIPGHNTGTCRKAAQRPSRNSQTAKISAVIEHHPTVDAASTGLESQRLQCLPALYLSLLRSHIPPKGPIPSQSLNTAPGCSQG